MKKLLFIWSGLRIGGSEFALLTLIKHLSDAYEIEVLCHQNICEYLILPDVKISYVKEARTKFLNKFMDKIYLLQAIYKHAKDVDVLICNEFPLLAICSYVVAKLQFKPLIIWNHSCRDEVILTTNSIVEWMYKYIFMHCKAVVNVSLYSEHSLFAYMNAPLSNSLVIYNIVDVAMSNLQHNIMNNKEKLCIVAIGSLVREKNFSLLIYAAESLVKDYHLDLEITICGDGMEMNTLLELVNALSLNEIIKFVGKVHNPLEYIRSSDLLVSTSNSESFSLVVCDAMMLNKPVIATNTGAAELLGNGKYGLVIDKNNKEQLVNAILTIAQNPGLVQAMIANYDEALCRFNAVNNLPKWHQVFACIVRSV